MLEQKTVEAEKLNRELKKTREYVNASLERSWGAAGAEKHTTS